MQGLHRALQHVVAVDEADVLRELNRQVRTHALGDGGDAGDDAAREDGAVDRPRQALLLVSPCCMLKCS